jgi:hypothetical protein
MAMADNDEDLPNEEMGVDADQITTSSSPANEFSGRTNFVPRRGSYRVSHEEGALHFATSLDYGDLFDDEDDSLFDDDDDSLPPSH